MWPLIVRTIKDSRFTILGYALIGVLLIWLYVALFPSVQEQAAELNKVLEQFPDTFLKAFNVGDAAMILSDLESFLASRHYGLMWPLMVIILAIGLASNAIANEIEKGRIEYLLSQPLSRNSYFMAKYISGVVILATFTIFSIYCIIPFAEMYGIAYDTNAYHVVSLMGFLFGLSVFSLAVFFSSLFSEKGKVSLAMTVIMIASYTANLVAALTPDLENLKYLSVFHYFDANVAMVDQVVNGTGALVFLTITVLSLLAGLITFNRRDIAV